MAIAWFIVSYKRRDVRGRPGRYCAMDDFTEQIVAEAGAWAETEVLGNAALVKVRASSTLLDKIASVEGFKRIPIHSKLSESLADLSAAQKTAIRNKIVALGYSESEVGTSLGENIGAKTLGDLLRFIAQRRLKPRYDDKTGAIVCDGIAAPTRSIESVDAEVKG